MSYTYQWVLPNFQNRGPVQLQTAKLRTVADSMLAWFLCEISKNYGFWFVGSWKFTAIDRLESSRFARQTTSLSTQITFPVTRLLRGYSLLC